MVSFARESDSEFTALQPDETGLRMTVYASERDDHPTLIVDSEPGPHFVPSAGSRAFEIGEPTGDPGVDAWVKENAETLRDYARGIIDSVDFYERMRIGRSR
jgi:hypothetical protein